MIEVHRIGVAAYSDTFWSGVGGLEVDGRWHERGMRIVYTAESLALAQLEILAHISDRRHLPALARAVAIIPDRVTIERIGPDTLPRDWRRYAPYSPTTQKVGTDWLARARTAVLQVPSAVSETDRDYLLNPLHSAFAQITLREPQPFTMDPRVIVEDQGDALVIRPLPADPIGAAVGSLQGRTPLSDELRARVREEEAAANAAE